MKSIMFVVSSVAVNAWWDSGHLLTARRAYDLLEVENPYILGLVNAKLAPLKKDYPSITFEEGDHPFVECATFADVIKGRGYSWQSPWHFVDQPYVDTPGKTIDDYPDFEPDETDVVDALTALTEFLMNVGEYKESTYYKQIVEHFDKLEDQQSFALRLIIHYVGDLH
jgi:hypothetical protein